jgi:hypothetical protein
MAKFGWRAPSAAAAMLAASIATAPAEEDLVGLWIKNTAPTPVTVSVDGAPACQLEAPVYKECKDQMPSQLKGKLKGKLAEKKNCTVNNLKISCITNVKASGVDVAVRRGDGIEYKVRAARGGTLHLCIEPKTLTDCFGTTLH